MNKLEKKRKEINMKLETFKVFQHYRNLDFPMNTLNVCGNNLSFLLNYFENTMSKPNYEIRLDTLLQTHVINYLNSVKGYVNRKKRAIEKSTKCCYKKDLLVIIEKYWHKNHSNLTSIEKVIELRDHFEHEKIDGLCLIKKYSRESTQLFLKYNEVDLLILFIDCYKELKNMNDEIENFIESRLKELNLRDCILFNEAFNRKFGIKEEYGLEPPANIDEISKYDSIIDELLKN